MATVLKRRYPFVQLFLLAALAGVGGAFIDWSIRSSSERLAAGTLEREAGQQLPIVRDSLERAVAWSKTLNRQSDSLVAMRIPGVADLEQLASRHHLQLTRLERTTGSKPNNKDETWHVVIMQGSLRALLNGLHDLETNYICRAERIVLQPVANRPSTAQLVLRIRLSDGQ